MTEAFVCDAVRTPIGRYGGALSKVRADDLAAIPLAELMKRNRDMDWSQVDDVYFVHTDLAQLTLIGKLQIRRRFGFQTHQPRTHSVYMNLVGADHGPAKRPVLALVKGRSIATNEPVHDGESGHGQAACCYQQVTQFVVEALLEDAVARVSESEQRLC